MRKIISLIIFISFNINAQDSDSISFVNDIYNEINKIKTYSDSIISELDNYKSSSNKKLINLERFKFKLKNNVDSNYLKIKTIGDSLNKVNENLIFKINENVKQLEKQSQIQFKNTESYLLLKGEFDKSIYLVIIFFIILIAILLFFWFYFKKNSENIRSDFEIKYDELSSNLKKLKETLLIISTSNEKLKSQNNSMSKNLKNLSQDLNKVKSSLK
tara:strand:+ start:303 stop:950 length:648 start_codon:yes stop_codon:yes gene_type:complete